MLAVRRPRQSPTERVVATQGQPVMLATLGVPFDSAAADFAVDAAVESAQPLIVVNVVEMIMGPQAFYGSSWEVEDEADAQAFAAPARLAASLGVRVERLRVVSLHPIQALVEVASERRPGLLVFGPDRAKLRPRRYRKAAQLLRQRLSCLLWLAE